MEKYDNTTGLTPNQEKAASLIVSGKSITDTAKTLKIDRGTLYNWMEKLTFQAYTNKLCQENQQYIINSIWGLYDKAVKAVIAGLDSKNESIKTKTAFWIIEKLGKLKVEESNPKEVIKKLCTSTEFDNMIASFFDEDKFKQLCQDNNIKP